MRKFLFLDIDGVLNSKRIKALGKFGDRTHTRTFGFADEYMERLNHISHSVYGMEIVISSAWRCLYEREVLEALMQGEGMDADIIDMTPMSRSVRGDDLQRWLDANDQVVGKTCKSVILDDADDMLHLLPYLVQTKWSEGLSDEEADEVIRRFNES